jgi:hypothetical protein
LLRDKIRDRRLGAAGADRHRSRPGAQPEHILLANIFEQAWRSGQDLDLAQLIMRIQRPPFVRQAGRFSPGHLLPGEGPLAAGHALNGIIASPTFADLDQGQPLDISGLLYGPTASRR